VLFATSFPKFGHPAFAWIALTPLIVAVAVTERTTTRAFGRQFAVGLLTGVVYFGGTLYWVVGVMTTYGGLGPWLAVPVGALMAAYLAIYPAIFAVILGRGIRRFGMAGVWLAPFFWVATEWVRGTIGGGFPWVLLGASQATVLPVVQLASVTGVYGLSALVALVGTAAAAVSLRRRTAEYSGAAAVLLVLVTAAGWGAWRAGHGRLVTEGRPVRVGLIQGDVEQLLKWDPAYRTAILDRYVDLSRRAIGAGADIVIWPESSTPFYFDANSELAEPVRALAAQSHTPFIIGSDESEPGAPGQPNRLYNTAVLVGTNGRSEAVYRKMRLVPFGEYVPFKHLLFFVGPLVQAVSDFSPGTVPVVFDAGGRRLSVAICYESVYPGIARAFVQRGSELLATITNDAWFGRSSAVYQHFDQGAIRAVEEGRYAVRAANTGISGAHDPYGRVVARTPLFEPVAITVDVRLLDDRTVYSEVGDLTAWLSLMVTGLVLIRLRWRAKP
jgi:apolipoprotein N-acyltransferase